MTHTKKRVVKMMFTVVVVFVVCWGPLQVFTVTKKYFLDDKGSLLPNMETVRRQCISEQDFHVVISLYDCIYI